MKKVIKLVDQLPRIFEIAVNLSDQGKFIESLSMLLRAKNLTEYETPDYVAVQLEIAEVYTSMGLFTNAIKIYLQLVRLDCDMEEVILGLVRSFTLLDQFPQAAYYLNLGIELGILESDVAIDPYEFSDEKNQSQIRLMKKDNSYLVSIAKQLMQSGDNDYSTQILEGIKEDSPQYKEANSCLAYIKLVSGDVESANKYIDKVLSLEPDNVAALCEKCLTYIISGENDKAAEIGEKIFSLLPYAEEELSRAVMTFARLGDNEKCLACATKILAERPYDRNMLLISAIALSNLNEKQKAKETIVKARTIYSGDYVISYYARQIEADEKNIPISCEIPYVKQEKLFEMLENMFIEAGGVDNSVKLINEGGEMHDLVMMALSGDNIGMQAKVASFLAQSKKFHPQILDLLIDPDFSLMAKKEALLEYLKFADDKSFALVINNLLQVFTPKLPIRDAGIKAENAFWTVYSTLSFVDIGFDKKLASAFKNIIPVLSAFPEISENVLAACIAYKSGANRIFFNKNSCCEVFNCDEKDFNAYYDYYLLNGKKNSTKKNKGVQSE